MYLLFLKKSKVLSEKSRYPISANSFLPGIVSPFNSFRGNYSIYEVKNCYNVESIYVSKKNSFLGNYTRKYGMLQNFNDERIYVVDLGDT